MTAARRVAGNDHVPRVAPAKMASQVRQATVSCAIARVEVPFASGTIIEQKV